MIQRDPYLENGPQIVCEEVLLPLILYWRIRRELWHAGGGNVHSHAPGSWAHSSTVSVHRARLRNNGHLAE